MGSDLCSDKNLTTDNNQFTKDLLIKEAEEIHQNQMLNRISEPSEYIGYNLNKLKPELKESQSLASLQSKIDKMASIDRKKNRPLNIKAPERSDNVLPDPYFIRSLNAVYIGEWVYNSSIFDEVPGGIGRLYTETEIYEGEIITKCLDVEEKQKADSTFTMLKRDKSFFQNTKILQQKDIIAPQGYKRISIILNGEGRRFTKTEEQVGIFNEGKLNGKGSKKIKEQNNVYQYVGNFVNGQKHGRGVQKYKNNVYEGDFVNNQKCGKGVLTLFISQKHQKQREEEQKNRSMQNKESNTNERIQIVKQFFEKRKNIQSRVAHYLKKYPWVIKPVPPNMNYLYQNQAFYIDQNVVNKYLQKYTGDFKNDKFNGRGVYTWFNGKTYNGQWKDGQMNGYGQFNWPDGATYRGYYQKDLKHGEGEMIWTISKRYRGSWAFGYRHGYGELIELKDNYKSVETDGKIAYTHLMVIKGAKFIKQKIEHVFFTEQFETDIQLHNFMEDIVKVKRRIKDLE